MTSRIEYFKAMAKLTEAHLQCGVRNEGITHHSMLPNTEDIDLELYLHVQRTPTEEEMPLVIQPLQRLKPRPKGEQVRPDYRWTPPFTKEDKEEK